MKANSKPASVGYYEANGGRQTVYMKRVDIQSKSDINQMSS